MDKEIHGAQYITNNKRFRKNNISQNGKDSNNIIYHGLAEIQNSEYIKALKRLRIGLLNI